MSTIPKIDIPSWPGATWSDEAIRLHCRLMREEYAHVIDRLPAAERRAIYSADASVDEKRKALRRLYYLRLQAAQIQVRKLIRSGMSCTSAEKRLVDPQATRVFIGMKADIRRKLVKFLHNTNRYIGAQNQQIEAIMRASATRPNRRRRRGYRPVQPTV